MTTGTRQLKKVAWVNDSWPFKVELSTPTFYSTPQIDKAFPALEEDRVGNGEGSGRGRGDDL